ncbi:MAG: CBS domain-containing protein [Candidatus Thermoplasmatota archaeon]|jgi:CBS domain-containing protein|nr:CBS domain-containing protein [Candidatus Thermoplasmatota archaeon]
MVLYAKDIMKNYTKTFPADTNALDGAKIMQQDHVGFLIVHDSGGKPVGIVTEWDYISKIVAAEKDPRKVTLGQIMKEGIISVEAETPTEKVTVIMGKNLIRRIPVFENGKLIGVITSRDIIRIFKDYMDSISDIIARFGNF